MFSCTGIEEECYEEDLSSCDSIAPEYAIVEIRCTFSDENNSIPVFVFKGNYPSADTILSDTININTNLPLPVNNNYSALAVYEQGNEQHFVIDGITIKREFTTICDYKCWKINTRDFQLQFE